MTMITATKIFLTIPGKPIAKKRPRFSRVGTFVKTYNCQETEEGRFLWEVKSQWHGQPTENPVILTCRFYMPIPKGTSKKKILMMKNNEIQHTKKPDLDNMIKFLKDCLNTVVWRDDSQVVRISAYKKYSDNPRTEMEIEEV